MISSVGTFTAALVVSVTMATSTSVALAPSGSAVEKITPPTPSVKGSLIASSGKASSARKSDSFTPAAGLVWDSVSHMRSWQTLFALQNYDSDRPDSARWLALTAEKDAIGAKKTVGPSVFDELNLVAPAFLPSKSLAAFLGTSSEKEYLKSLLGEVDVLLLEDAAEFYAKVKELAWVPDIWADDGEVAFEWIEGSKHAVVSIEGDGHLGYTLLINGRFVPGRSSAAAVSSLPRDLLDYLTADA